MSRTIAKPPYSILARYYDRLVGDDARKMNRHARRKILGETLSRARVVCDLGCGTGSTAIELARAGKKVYAVDLSPGMCRLARQKARRARQEVAGPSFPVPSLAEGIPAKKEVGRSPTLIRRGGASAPPIKMVRRRRTAEGARGNPLRVSPPGNSMSASFAPICAASVSLNP